MIRVEYSDKVKGETYKPMFSSNQEFEIKARGMMV